MKPEYEWLISLPSLIAIALSGMFIHFLKSQIKGETITEIKDYFKSHFKSTVIAFVVTIVSTLGYYFNIKTGGFADVIAVFLLGYTFDSILNKWDKASI